MSWNGRPVRMANGACFYQRRVTGKKQLAVWPILKEPCCGACVQNVAGWCAIGVRCRVRLVVSGADRCAPGSPLPDRAVNFFLSYLFSDFLAVYSVTHHHVWRAEKPFRTRRPMKPRRSLEPFVHVYSLATEGKNVKPKIPFLEPDFLILSFCFGVFYFFWIHFRRAGNLFGIFLLKKVFLWVAVMVCRC